LVCKCNIWQPGLAQKSQSVLASLMITIYLYFYLFLLIWGDFDRFFGRFWPIFVDFYQFLA
jgi:hypothetical protein